MAVMFVRLYHRSHCQALLPQTNAMFGVVSESGGQLVLFPWKEAVDPMTTFRETEQELRRHTQSPPSFSQSRTEPRYVK